jgi:hypothetical protein
MCGALLDTVAIAVAERNYNKHREIIPFGPQPNYTHEKADLSIHLDDQESYS